MNDYLWRWDTDWFWCSRRDGRPAPGRPAALAAPLPALGRLPQADRAQRPHRRSSTASTGWKRPAPARAGGPGRRGAGRAARGVPRVVRPGGRDAPGLAVPAGLARHRDRRGLAELPAPAADDLRQRRLLGHRRTSARTPPTRPLNRAIEAKVHELDGHKSLYSEAFYDRETFDGLYGGANLAALKAQLRPRRPVPHPLRQGGAQTMTQTQSPSRPEDLSIAEALDSLLMEPLPLRFTAYDGSATGPEDAPYRLHLANERGLTYLLTAPGDLGLRRAYVGRRPGDGRAPPRRPVRAAQAGAEPACRSAARRRPRRSILLRSLGLSHLKPLAAAAAGVAVPAAPHARGRAALAGARRRGDPPPLRRVQRRSTSTSSARR